MNRIVKKLNDLSTTNFESVNGLYLVSDITEHGKSILIRLSNDSIIFLKNDILSRDEIKLLSLYVGFKILYYCTPLEGFVVKKSLFQNLYKTFPIFLADSDSDSDSDRSKATSCPSIIET